jgi:Tol biopolymer transport system component
MSDLKTRFRGAERIPTPDLWSDIIDRQPRPLPVESSPTRRVLVATFAVAIAAAGVTFAIRAFEGPRGGPQPITQAPLGTINGVIAYASIGDEQVFWTIRPDGGDPTQVHVDVPGFVGVPSWSPDGTRIAFDVNSFDDPHPKGGNVDIYTANADGTDPARLTSEKIDHSAVWSPNGTRIAYVHGYSNDQQIWIMNADGSDPRQVTERSGLNISPSWSPDGAKIAFVSWEGSNSDIYVINVDGSDVSRLTVDPAHEDQPAWSPDGERIAFTSEGAGDPGIYSITPDGSDATELLHDPDPANLGMAWSPDGTQMAVVSIRGPDNDRNVYVLDLATGELTSIGEPGAYFGASWQPLASEPVTPAPINDPVVTSTIPRDAIVFSSSTAEGAQTNLFFVSPDGGSASPVTDVTPGMAADEAGWAPDGIHLAFVMGPARHLNAYAGDANLYVLDLSTGALVQLTEGLATASPSWSPDGQRIAFVAGQGTTLDVINLDGTGRHTVASARGYYQRPAWSPDGSVITFQSSPDRTSEQTAIFTIRPDGTGERQLTSGTTSEGFPSWSPDGTRIAYSAADRLGIMDADGSHERPLGEDCHLPCVADFSPTWSPDGQRIVFVRQEDGGATRHLYVVDLSSGEIHALTPSEDWVGAATSRSVPS